VEKPRGQKSRATVPLSLVTFSSYSTDPRNRTPEENVALYSRTQLSDYWYSPHKCSTLACELAWLLPATCYVCVPEQKRFTSFALPDRRTEKLNIKNLKKDLRYSSSKCSELTCQVPTFFCPEVLRICVWNTHTDTHTNQAKTIFPTIRRLGGHISPPPPRYTFLYNHPDCG
jgi:hypothetical protein